MTETIQIKVPMWNIESETGYKPRTTFWQDFSVFEMVIRFNDPKIRIPDFGFQCRPTCLTPEKLEIGFFHKT